MEITPDNLRDIGLHLPLEDLYHLAITDKWCYRELFGSEHLWSRYTKDRDRPEGSTWFQHYKKMATTWFGIISSPERRERIELEIPDGKRIRYLSVRVGKIVATTHDGEIWICGYTGYRCVPKRVEGIEDLDVVEAHYSEYKHITALTSGGDVYEISLVYDTNLVDRYKLYNIKISSLICDNGYVYRLDVDGNMYRDHSMESVVFPDKKIIKADCGIDYMMALDGYGDLWGRGSGIMHIDADNGLLKRNVKDFSCATRLAAVIDREGWLWMCGDSIYVPNTGVDGFTHVSCGVVKVCCDDEISIIINVDDSVWYIGRDIFTGSRDIVYRFTELPDAKWSDVVCDTANNITIVMYRHAL